MASRQDRQNARINAYQLLSQTVNSILPLSASRLSQTDLDKLRIECLPMNLSSEKSNDASPHYCTPLSSAELDDNMTVTFDLEDEDVPEWPRYDPDFYPRYHLALQLGLTLLEYLGSSSYPWQMLAKTHWIRSTISTSDLTYHYAYYPNSNLQWGTIQILHVKNLFQSHLACVLIDDAPADKGLRSSELYTVVTLMQQSIELDTKGQFLIYPVYVYSIAGREARILEAVVEKGKLRVRMTEYLDFKHEDPEKLKLYLRWMMNTPKRNTSFASDPSFGGQKELGDSDTESSGA